MKTNRRQESSLRQGLDIEAFESFCEFARANPAEVAFDLQANGVYEGRAVHTTARSGPYTLGGQKIDRSEREYVYRIGAHKEVEEALGFTEPTDRPEATEIVLAALTACINAAVSTSALKRGIELNHLETRVRISWDPHVFLHLSEPARQEIIRDQFAELEIQLMVDAEDLTEEEMTYLRESVKRSAVYNLLRLGRDCSPVIERASAAIAA